MVDVDHKLPISSRLPALISVRTAIALRIPRASRTDRHAWRRLQNDLHNVQLILASGDTHEEARELIDETLDVLLRFRSALCLDERAS